MSQRTLPVLTLLLVALAATGPALAAPAVETKRFAASPGGTLTLDLEAGGSVKITGDGGSGISVSYSASFDERSPGSVAFEERADGLKIVSRFSDKSGRHQSSDIDLEIHVPSRYDIELDSMGGGLEIVGLEGTFRGKTMGGELKLQQVRGEARLKTMGGEIHLTDSELDGSLETMGGEVLFRDVTGDVEGSSMGGEVRYERVHRRDGRVAKLEQLEDLPELTDETVQITTMGGPIEVEDARDGVSLHTMGGDIHVKDAARFVKVTTMGGDIRVDEVDGWVQATTMGGDIEVHVVGSGGDVELTSMSGNVTLLVPAGFSMDLDLELAFTRGSGRDHKLVTDFELPQTVSDDWDYGQGSPRKYVRAKGAVGGGGHRVKIRTINGDLTVRRGR